MIMEEQVARFVATEEKLPLPPPPSEVGFIGNVRRNLFATPLDSVLSDRRRAFIVWAVMNIFDWAWLDAVFTGCDREACLVEDGGHGGACWAFVSAKFGQFMYGIYPFGERWRVDMTLVLLAMLVAGVAIPRVPYKRLNAILLFAVFPFVALVLLTGGEFAFPAARWRCFLLLIAAAATTPTARPSPTSSFSQMPVQDRRAARGPRASSLLVSAASWMRLCSASSATGSRSCSLAAFFASLGGDRAGGLGRLPCRCRGRRLSAGCWRPTLAALAFIVADDRRLRAAAAFRPICGAA